MKRIEIKNYEDLKQLKELDTYEEYYICLNIPYKMHMEVIDLSNFKGRIYLSLDNRHHHLSIKTNNIKNSFLFFANTTGKIYVIGSPEKYECTYEVVPKIIHVSNDIEFQRALKIEGIKTIILDDNIIIHDNNPLIVPSNINIVSNNYRIFYPATKPISYKEEYNELFKYINKMIAIKKESDLKKLYNLNAETVLIEFKKDIEGREIQSINVPPIVKNMYVFGHNHTLKDIKINGDSRNGLFSNIPIHTSLYVDRLNMNYIYLKCDKKTTECAGLLLGSHGGYDKNFSYASPITVNNCSFKQCLIDECKKYAGIISGTDYEETKVINCDVEQVIYSSYALKSFFGSHEVMDMAYYDGTEIETAYSLKRKKNV